MAIITSTAGSGAPFVACGVPVTAETKPGGEISADSNIVSILGIQSDICLV